jgi:hypothetical protein
MLNRIPSVREPNLVSFLQQTPSNEWPVFCKLQGMRKARFVPLEKKQETQILFDASLSGQQRIDRMFELIDALMKLRPFDRPAAKPNSITLKRKRGTIS